VQTCSGVRQASYSMGTGVSFPGVKRPGREVNHSPPVNAEVRMAGTRAVESESEGILGGVGIGKNVPTPTSI
jgi:hypothetical protein